MAFPLILNSLKVLQCSTVLQKPDWIYCNLRTNKFLNIYICIYIYMYIYKSTISQPSESQAQVQLPLSSSNTFETEVELESKELVAFL